MSDCGTTKQYRRGCRCKECRAANAEQQRRYRKTTKGKLATRNANLRHSFGIDARKYEELLEDQGSVCAICRTKESRKNQHGILPLAVDHCHDTGAIRGLLCMNCNRGLGLIKDNPSIAQNLASYLKKASTCTN